MKILHICPSKIATGGTDGIHHMVSEMNKSGVNAQILYVGSKENPQPSEYSKVYECPYITEFPADYQGAVIFPEIWANQTLEDKYKECITVVNWQGVDVYDWHTPVNSRNAFLARKDTIHIVNSDYAVDHLQKLGIEPIKYPDAVNEEFFSAPITDENARGNVVLYNPVSVKLTDFQRTVMARCTTELGVKFKALEGYTRDQLIDLFTHSKLYIDFGVFSGRERLPREAVLCGCCILTSNKGAASYYGDNVIPDKYKIEDVNTAISTVKHILRNYGLCKPDFDTYRQMLRQDRDTYSDSVKEICNAIQRNNPSI